MFARVVLPVDQKALVLTVPKDALVLGGPEPVVYMAEADPKTPGKTIARPLQVKAGTAFGGWVEVAGAGLKAGQHVVIEGNERLMPGAELKVAISKESDPNRTPSGSKTQAGTIRVEPSKNTK